MYITVGGLEIIGIRISDDGLKKSISRMSERSNSEEGEDVMGEGSEGVREEGRIVAVLTTRGDSVRLDSSPTVRELKLGKRMTGSGWVAVDSGTYVYSGLEPADGT